jgi:hypothetical protein
MCAYSVSEEEVSFASLQGHAIKKNGYDLGQ